MLSDAYEKVGKTEKAKSAMQELKQVITKSPAAIRAWGEDYLKVRKIER